MTTLQDTVRREVIDDYGVLTAPTSDLDGLVWLAATLCDVPTAVINIIDDRWQHQVAAVGFEASVCSREDSMCAAVFQRAEQVVVSDARLDERFATNPFVTGEIGDVRFYASSPLVTPDGIPIGTLCVFDDVVGELTPEHARGLTVLAEQVVDALELRRVARELRHSNEQLESFAGQIGHDLRNPLTAVAGFVELAASSPELDPEVRGWLARADASARRMHAMISDLLEYASLGGASPRRDELDLTSVVAAVLDDLDAAIGETSAHVTVDIDASATGDPTLVRALLQNLVANAIKFSSVDGGRPRVEITASEVGDVTRITVDDNGPGVPVEQRTRVFDLMERAAADGVPGLGIGLATCRRIVEAHGGRIGIEDSPLGGARVWATLPRG